MIIVKHRIVSYKSYFTFYFLILYLVYENLFITLFVNLNTGCKLIFKNKNNLITRFLFDNKLNFNTLVAIETLVIAVNCESIDG